MWPPSWPLAPSFARSLGLLPQQQAQWSCENARAGHVTATSPSPSLTPSLSTQPQRSPRAPVFQSSSNVLALLRLRASAQSTRPQGATAPSSQPFSITYPVRPLLATRFKISKSPQSTLMFLSPFPASCFSPITYHSPTYYVEAGISVFPHPSTAVSPCLKRCPAHDRPWRKIVE